MTLQVFSILIAVSFVMDILAIATVNVTASVSFSIPSVPANQR